MRFIVSCGLTVLAAVTLAQNYQEGALSLPGVAATPLELRLQVWSVGEIITARTGGETVLFVLDSPSNPSFELVDLETRQAVTVTASNDPASLKSLNEWEGSFFPLLPGHAGFASDWDDFAFTIQSLQSAGILSQVKTEGNENGSGSISYSSALPEIGGKVTWGFENFGGERQMVTWSYTPTGTKGMRSARIGEGEIQTEKQSLVYGVGPEGIAPNIEDFKSFAQAQVQIVSGNLMKADGFLASSEQASKWLLNRTVYRLEFKVEG